MIDYIDTPLTYIMGIRRELWNNKSVKKRILANEIIVFDIDSKQFDKSPLFSFNVKLLEEDLNEDVVSKEMIIKSKILRMYLELMGDYSKYREGNSFRVEEYLKSVRSESYAFMREFVRTNLFLKFIEKMSSNTELESLFKTINDQELFSRINKKVLDAIKNVILFF